MDKRRYTIFLWNYPSVAELASVRADNVVLDSLRPFNGAASWRSLNVGEQTTCLTGMGARRIVLRLEDAP